MNDSAMRLKIMQCNLEPEILAVLNDGRQWTLLGIAEELRLPLRTLSTPISRLRRSGRVERLRFQHATYYQLKER